MSPNYVRNTVLATCFADLLILLDVYIPFFFDWFCLALGILGIPVVSVIYIRENRKLSPGEWLWLIQSLIWCFVLISESPPVIVRFVLVYYCFGLAAFVIMLFRRHEEESWAGIIGISMAISIATYSLLVLWIIL